MQRFLVVTIGNTIHLQSSQIMKDAAIYVYDEFGACVLIENINKKNFMHIQTQLPGGSYKIHVIEKNVEWTKNIILDYDDILTK